MVNTSVVYNFAPPSLRKIKNGFYGTALLVTMASAFPLAAAPVNDNFNNAIEVTGAYARLTGTNIEATKASDDPATIAGNAGGKSVWYKWTSPAYGYCTIDTQNPAVSSPLDTLLGVYTDASGNLNLIAENDNAPGKYRESELTFATDPGITYYLLIDGKKSTFDEVATGNFVFHLSYTAGLPNDNQADAILLYGTVGSVGGFNNGATGQDNDPVESATLGGKSIWWTWTAPASGVYTWDTIGSNFDTLLGIYRGNPGALTSVALSDDEGGSGLSKTTFNATAGTVYKILVDGKGGAVGKIRLNWTLPPPPNDTIENAISISGPSGIISGYNIGATVQTGEPQPSGTAPGVWYKWTAPSTNVFEFKNPAEVGKVRAYNKATLPLDTDDEVGYAFSGYDVKDGIVLSAVQGQTYMFLVSKPQYSTPGAVNLTWDYYNDDFARARLLTGNVAEGLGTNVPATRQPGEPSEVAGNAGNKSIWWKWTASEYGYCTVRTRANNFPLILLGVYTGTLGNLTLQGEDLNSQGDGSIVFNYSQVSFFSTPGTTYYFLVDGPKKDSSSTDHYSGALGLYLDFEPGLPNDDFFEALPLYGSSGTFRGSNHGATKQAGEPATVGNNTGGASVWWTWKAPATGKYTWDTFGSGFNTVMGIYSLDSSGLTSIAENDDSGGVQSLVTFNGIKDREYKILVGGFNGASGKLQLNWKIDPPANDNLTNALTMTGTSGIVSGHNIGATLETNEPTNLDTKRIQGSIWWQWTAPSTETYELNLLHGDVGVIGIYTGTAYPLTLQKAIKDEAPTTFDAVAGVTYKIMLDANNWRPDAEPVTGEFILSWKPVNAIPSNDNFANATIISDKNGWAAGDNRGATRQTGEPATIGELNSVGSKSVWWKWTAPETGDYAFGVNAYTFHTRFNPLLAVAKDSLASLEIIAENENSPVQIDDITYDSYVAFHATAGTTYYILVDGSPTPDASFYKAAGVFKLEWEKIELPPNDNFANAIALNGGTGRVNGDTTRATAESTDPELGDDDILKSSVWWKWTAPTSGKVIFDTRLSGSSTHMAIYTGSQENLTLIGKNEDAFYGGPVTFDAVAGRQYFILVIGETDEYRGPVTLEWTNAFPPNDDFANARNISGSFGTSTVNNALATMEPAELTEIDGEASDRSVWWKWTSPGDGSVIFDAGQSNFHAALTLYKGTSMATAELLAATSNAAAPIEGTPQIRRTAVRTGDVLLIAIRSTAKEYDPPQYGNAVLSWTTTIGGGPAPTAADSWELYE